jgi:hypothetical protein
MRFLRLAVTVEPALAVFCCVGLLLVGQALFLRMIADRFLFEIALAKSPILPFVASQIIAGLVFFSLFRLIPSITPRRAALLLMLLTGLAMRVLLFGTIPILEVDFYRYLWDGAVVAQGHNPYLFAPDSIMQGSQVELQGLAQQAGIVFERINYSALKTIYPPLAQLMFAVASWFDAWNLDTWRLLLLACEIVSFCLLLALLRELKRSQLWAALYWWNPLVIKEVFNSAHMDALLVPLILGAILLIIRKRQILAGSVLTLAAGIKLWPLLLIPFSLRPLMTNPRKLGIALAVVGLVTLIVVGPLFYFALGADSGLSEYSQSWQRNSGLFQLVLAFGTGLAMPFDSIDAGYLARVLVTVLLGGLAVYLNRSPTINHETLVKHICWLVAALFLLSPAQYPWYTIWLAPLLCLYPQRGLLLLTVLMPIYYLRFYFDARNQTELFDQYIVWLQYLPVYVLLLRDNLRPKKQPRYSQHYV